MKMAWDVARLGLVDFAANYGVASTCANIVITERICAMVSRATKIDIIIDILAL